MTTAEIAEVRSMQYQLGKYDEYIRLILAKLSHPNSLVLETDNEDVNYILKKIGKMQEESAIGRTTIEDNCIKLGVRFEIKEKNIARFMLRGFTRNEAVDKCIEADKETIRKIITESIIREELIEFSSPDNKSFIQGTIKIGRNPIYTYQIETRRILSSYVAEPIYSEDKDSIIYSNINIRDIKREDIEKLVELGWEIGKYSIKRPKRKDSEVL